MRKNLFLLIAFLLCCVSAALAQNNDKISYQAVVRNSANQLVYNTDLIVTVSIANSEGGASVYSEWHAVTSNANGLISLLIGDGEYLSGSWNSILWNHAFVTTVVAKNNEILSTVTIPLSAVPYALTADYADSVNEDVIANYLTAHGYLTEEVQVLSISNDTVFLTGGSFVKLPAGFSGDYNDLTNKPTNVSTFTNDAGYLTSDSAVITNLQGDVTTLQGDVTTLQGNVTTLQEATRKDALCDSVESCVKGWISDSTRMVIDSLGAYYDTTHMKMAIHDTAEVLRSMMTDAANDAKITIQKNGELVDDFTVNQATDKTIDIPVPTTVAEMTDASNYVTTTHLNDTLSHYTTTDKIDTLLGDYVTTEKLNDTLSYYTTTDKIDTLLGDYVTTTKLNDTLSTVYTKIQSDSTTLVDRIVTDSTALADKIHSDSLTLATRMDTLLTHVCDSVETCVKGWIGDTLNAYTTTDKIDTLLGDYVTNTKLNDTLSHYTTTDKVDTLLGDYVTTTKLNDTLSHYTTTDKVDTLLGDYVTNTHLNDTLSHYTTTDKIDTLLGDYVTTTKLNDTLSHYTTTDKIDTLLGDYVTTTKLNDTLNAYYDTTNVQQILHDTANVLRNEMPVVNNGQITISVNRGTVDNSTFNVNQDGTQTVTINIPDEVTVNNGQLTVITQDDTTRFTANQSVNDTVNLTGFVTTAHLNDTLSNYTTTDKIDTLLGDYVTTEKLNDTLSYYTTTDKIDTLLGDYVTTTKLNDTLSHYTTTDKIDTLLGDYVTTEKLNDTLSTVYTKIQSDSTTLVDRIVTDSTALAEKIHSDSLTLATRMDTLLTHVCDSVETCVTGWIGDTLASYYTKTQVDSIDHADSLTLATRIYADSVTLATRIFNDSVTLTNRIYNDSLTLATRMDTLLKHVCDSVETCVTGWIGDTLASYYTKTQVDSIDHADSLTLATRIYADSVTLTNRIYNDSVTLTNRIYNDSLTLATRMDTLLNHVCDSVETCVTGWIGDTLASYYTKTQVDSIDHADSLTLATRIYADSVTLTTRIYNDSVTLTNRIYNDSLTLATRMDTLLKHVCDSVETCVTGWIGDTLASYYTKTQVDSIDHADSLTLATRIYADSVTLATRIYNDSVTLTNRIYNDSLTLATRMDTLLKHVCDSVETCVTGWIGDTLNAYTTTDKIDTLLGNYVTTRKLNDTLSTVYNKIQSDSTVLADKIHSDSLTLATRMDTLLTHVCDSVEDCVKGWISDSTRMVVDSLNAYYDTTRMKMSIHDTAEVLRGEIPVVNDGQLSISVNGGSTQTFTANQSGNTEVNISVPTCDDLANCDLIQNILNRLERLEYLNDSLANELDKLKPTLTVAASEDNVTVCRGSSKPVTYKATFHNCSSSDYTISWKVNGTDSSAVTGDVLTFNAETEGDYTVVCVATRSDNTSVTDTVTTTVIVDNAIPFFNATANNLTVTLSDVVNTATIQWDTDSVPVEFTTSEHTYAVADTITITATSERGCTFIMGLRLQAMAPAVTTDSIPTGMIAATTAKAYGTVTSDGGVPATKRGMVYSTSNQNLELGVSGVDSVMNGTGMGSYSCNLKRLVPCTQYYVRAFAFNEVDTAYGEVKEFTTPSFTCGNTLTDFDGNEYATLLLGSQCWMKQNLRTTHYADGTEIALGNTSSDFNSPFRYAPGSESAEVLNAYGYLYNWAASMHSGTSSSANPSGVQGVCPNGWHLPSDAEWTQLTNFVASDNANVCGGNPVYIAKALASKEMWGNWGTCSVNCLMCADPSSNNSTGFSALPSGTWNSDGAVGHGTSGYTNYGHTIFRSATEYENSYAAWVREFYNEYAYVGRTAIAKTTGLPVRCVLDCATGHSYLPTVSAVKFTDTVGTAVSMSASVSSDGGATVTERGVCWGTSSQPTISSDHTADSGTGLGDFTVTGTLTPGTAYYVRAYATNSEGTAYGAEMTFVMPNLPTVTTTAVTDITAHTATSGGEVTADGGSAVTARGVCWSTSNNPTVDNDTTLNGNGTGSFVASVKNLNPGETYYVRAYATNAVGTAYGNEVTITTPDWSLSLASDGDATIKLCGDPNKTVTYTATPSYGTADDYTYSWSCSGGTISGTPTSNTATITFNSANTYTVSCTATHNTEHFDVDATISTTIVSGGAKRHLAMCSDGLTIESKETSASNIGFVSSISWGDGTVTNNIAYNQNFSHTYASAGVYTVTIIPSSANDCEVTRTFAMGDAVLNPCMVAVAHTNNSAYTPQTGGLETTNSEGKITTVADNDGNTYKVAQIGSQCWMAENLRTTVKPDGTPIPVGTEANSSTANTAYRYDPVGGVNADPYGYFYNWTAVMNGASASNTNPSGVRGICPLGWHVPGIAEWNEMLSEAGTNNAAKLAAGCEWYDYSNNNTPNNYRYAERNLYGFEALPAGVGLSGGNFSKNAYFWTSHSSSSTSAYCKRISYNNSSVQESTGSKYNGYSLRCVRDGGIAEPINLSVTTSAADNIEQTSATLNGSISNPDNIAISAQGFEWKAATDGSYTQVSASGTTLSHNLTGLTPYTTYTFHAFATTSDGTVYGDEMSFTTEALEFTVTTAPATEVSYTSATLNGAVANPAHANVTVTAQGFEWKTTNGGSYTQVPVSGTTLSYNLTGLTTGTGYTFRTFATLASGSTVYGSEESFTTLSYRRILLDTIQHDFVAQYGDTLVNTLSSPHKISIAAGATVTLRNATINGEDNENYAWAGISCEEGDATINLEGANTVKGFATYPGIYIDQGYTLTIQGAGSLNAGSYGNGAGIGGGYQIPCGNIVIGGGVINATGALYAAGLGSGAGASCGGITINGGTLTANGGNWAPGIGAGLGYGLNSECGNINISSGTVIAQGGQYAAGIGAGVAYTKPSVCGNISISGGTVTATGGERGAGIGAGVGNSSNSTCGNIGISGGEVTATGGSQSNNTNGGTGIGTGYSFENGVGVSSCGDITIESSVIRVTATKGWYAYTIGKDRFNANSLSTCGTVTIGGTVYYDGSDFQNGGNDPTTGLSHSPYVYEP